jgi:hypothetical protein
MTISTARDTATTPLTVPPQETGPDGHVTLGWVISAELIKLRSVRSTVAATLIAALSIVGAGVFAAIGIIVAKPPPGAGVVRQVRDDDRRDLRRQEQPDDGRDHQDSD